MRTLTLAQTSALRTLPYARKLASPRFDSLARRCRAREFARGESLFREGDPADGIHLLVAGRVKVVRASPSGREQVLHEEGPGATFGDVPVFDGGRYLASAMAVEPSTVVFVPRDALLDELRRNPDALMDAVVVLCRRVRKLASVIEDLALRDVTARVARYLLAGARRARAAEFPLRGTHAELGAKLGTVREEVSRALGQLRARGAIALAGGTVTILSPEILRTAARRRR